MFSVESDIKKAADQLAQLSDRFADTAIKNALNRMASMTQAEANRQIRQTYNIKISALNKQMTTIKATPANLTATVLTKGRAYPIIGFAGTAQVATGVQVQIKVNGGPKVIAHAFIQTMKSGHKGVFLRVGKKSLPIDEKFTLSLPHMFASRKIQEAAEQVVTNNFAQRLEHEIAYLLGKQVGL